MPNVPKRSADDFVHTQQNPRVFKCEIKAECFCQEFPDKSHRQEIRRVLRRGSYVWNISVAPEVVFN